VDQLRETAPDLLSGRIIVANLGAQASMCAIHAGRSVDTSVGFSVLDGLPSGTRSGAIDSGALLYLLQSHTFREVENLLNCKSGLLGVSGISGDLCELLASEHPRAAEAVDFFVYRAVREIGSLTAALGGLDALIFTGSAGEASPLVRHRVTEPLRWLGIAVDKAANNRGRGCISPAGRSPSVWVVPSDEDSVVAVATRECVGGSAAKPARRPTSVAEGVN
jgi:acetate kinase